MPETIPANFRDLFTKKAFANLGTLMPDGRPQVLLGPNPFMERVHTPMVWPIYRGKPEHSLSDFLYNIFSFIPSGKGGLESNVIMCGV